MNAAQSPLAFDPTSNFSQRFGGSGVSLTGTNPFGVI